MRTAKQFLGEAYTIPLFAGIHLTVKVVNTSPLYSSGESIGNFATMSDMQGRVNGFECQHDKQMFHHSSVNRRQVVSSKGRSGGPFSMRMIKCESASISGKGRCRVKSSFFYIGH